MAQFSQEAFVRGFGTSWHPGNPQTSPKGHESWPRTAEGMPKPAIGWPKASRRPPESQPKAGRKKIHKRWPRLDSSMV